MPNFLITAPDGTKYNVTGPEGSTEQEALAQVQAQHVQAAPQADTAADSEARGLPPIPADAAALAAARAGRAASGQALMDHPVNAAIGAGETALTGIPGIPGDTEQLGRLALSPFGVSRETTLPTTGDIANKWFGQPTDSAMAQGRAVGGLASPFIMSKVASVLTAPAKVADALSPVAAAAADARKAGYVVPPNMASDNPSLLSQGLSALGGKVKTQQLASTKNAATGTESLAEDLGLPKDTALTPATLEGVRAKAGQAYEAARAAPIQVIPDAKYAQDVAAVDQRGAAGRAEAPGLVKNGALDDLTKELGNVQQLSPAGAVDIIKSLRFKAQKNLGAVGASPETLELGNAQSKAANALETLLERNLEAATTARAPIGAQGGDMTELVDNLRKARTTIAKTYNIQDAANPVTGVINPRDLAALTYKGAPLTGALKDLANAATAFPKAFQNPASFGGNEKFSVLDAAFALGNKAGAAVLGRPAARSLLLSNLYQNAAIPKLPPSAVAGATGAVGPAGGASSMLNNPVIRALLLQRALSTATAPVTQP